MKFTLTNGALTIRATSAKEVKELLDHFRLDVTAHIDDLVKGHLEHVSFNAKRPWFAVGAQVPFTFLQPYYDRLKQITGYAGPAFDIVGDRLRYCSRRLTSLCHTHLVTEACISAQGYQAIGFIASEDWNGRPADERAVTNFNEYLREHLGDRKSEPEFLEINSGLLRRNPNYGKRYPPHPAAKSEAVFEVIFSHWLHTLASREQIALFIEAAACYKTVVKSTSLAAALLHLVREFHLEHYSRTVTFEQFQEMGNV